jgi:hypothetical protein
MLENKKNIIVTTVSNSLPFFKGQVNILKEYLNMAVLVLTFEDIKKAQ